MSLKEKANRVFGLSSARVLSWERDEYVADRLEVPVDEIFDALDNIGLSYFHLDGGVTNFVGNKGGTSIIVYDRESLQSFLDDRKDVLIEAQWPTNADKFVIYCAYVTAPANTAIFDLIYDAYNDFSNNIWLRRNANTTPQEKIDWQRGQSQASKNKFLWAFPDWTHK